MGMTIGEKILARASGKPTVSAGEIVTAKVDYCMSNDGTTHLNIDIFEKKLTADKVFDPDKMIFIVDHNIPAESPKSAEVHKKMRRFAQQHGKAVAMLANDDALIIDRCGKEQHVPAAAIRWSGRP